MTAIPFELMIAAVSIAAGLIGSLVGLGGGIIVTPLLVLGFGIDMRYAMGAALVAVIATSAGSGSAYLKRGMTNIRVGMLLCVATTMGAVIGAVLVPYVHVKLLSIIFGGVLLLTLVIAVFNRKHHYADGRSSSRLATVLQLPGRITEQDGTEWTYPVVNVMPGFVVMAGAGLLSGLLGIGSGAFKVLGMEQFMKLPFKVTTAISNFMIGVTAMASVGIYLTNGYFDPLLAGPVAIGVLIGSQAGSRLLPILPARLLRMIFSIAVSLIGLQMILNGLGVAT